MSALNVVSSSEMADLVFHQPQPVPAERAPQRPFAETVLANGCEIPRYLHSSNLAKALHEDGEAFSLLSMYYKENDTIYDLADFAQLLRVSAFWALAKLPAGLCHYCLQNDVTIWEKRLHSTLRPTSIIPHQLSYIFGHTPSTSRIARAIEVGRPEFVELFVVLREGVDVSTMNTAAYVGAISCMDFLASHNYPYDETTCAAAVCGGHLDCLKYARKNGYPWDSSTTDMAASRGFVDILRYYLDHDCPQGPELHILAVSSGNLCCLKYLIEERNYVLNLDVNGLLFGAAFERGNVECMQYLFDVGCTFQSYVFMCDHRNPNTLRDEWDARLCACVIFAVQIGWSPNVEFVSYVHANMLRSCVHYLDIVI